MTTSSFYDSAKHGRSSAGCAADSLLGQWQVPRSVCGLWRPPALRLEAELREANLRCYGGDARLT